MQKSAITVRYLSKKSHAGETKLGIGKIKGLIRTENQSLPPAEGNCFECLPTGISSRIQVPPT